MIKLKMYPAKNGDAFLVNAAGTYVLIDAGYKSTFANYIRSDLTQLSQANKRLSLAVSTHIDVDHIGGMLEFLLLNGGSDARNIIDVDNVWHNSLRSLPAPSCLSDSKQDIALLQAIRRRGFPNEPEAIPNPIGVKHGISLARMLREGGYAWNSGDGTRCISNTLPPLSFPNGVKLQVIGPPIARLEELREWWKKEMRRLSYRGDVQISDLMDEVYEILCATVPQPLLATVVPISAKLDRRLEDIYTADTSISNGSSIAFILYLKEWSMLFLGDAWAEDTIAEIGRLRLGEDSLLFNAIKISHHGSLHNTSAELLSLIDAPCYLISSDGSCHGHPDFEVLAEIVDRPADFERQLFFNYDTPAYKRIQTHTSRSGAKFSVHMTGSDWISIVGEEND